jgi:hypothetical protein
MHCLLNQEVKILLTLPTRESGPIGAVPAFPRQFAKDMVAVVHNICTLRNLDNLLHFVISQSLIQYVDEQTMNCGDALDSIFRRLIDYQVLANLTQ